MMTALVAAFGLLPAAFATGVGTDSQKPFALVIVGGLFSRLLISVFLMPVLYEVAARSGRPSGGVGSDHGLTCAWSSYVCGSVVSRLGEPLPRPATTGPRGTGPFGVSRSWCRARSGANFRGLTMTKREDALDYHSAGTARQDRRRPHQTARPTSATSALAYSPGVAEPCLEIQANPEDAYKYTAKGNLVAVVTNGTAVLGLGNIGALAGKPVMEGKGNLFKQFADIDVFDLEVGLGEPRRRHPVLPAARAHRRRHQPRRHQRAGLLLHRGDAAQDDARFPSSTTTSTARRSSPARRCSTRSRCVGQGHRPRSGSSSPAPARPRSPPPSTTCGSACGASTSLMCDREGVIYAGRAAADMDPYKARFARQDRSRARSPRRCVGADVFVGLSVAGAVTGRDGRARWRPRPIIFALANPVPEILPEEVRAVRDDAIIATGRSDYPEPGQQRPRLPVHLPRRARRAGHGDQRGDEDGGDARARRAGQGGRARQRGRAVRAASTCKFGPEYLIPFPVRPARAALGSAGRGVGRGGQRRGARVRRPRRVPRAARGAARARPRHHARPHQPRHPAIPSASSSPRARSPRSSGPRRFSSTTASPSPILLGNRAAIEETRGAHGHLARPTSRSRIRARRRTARANTRSIMWQQRQRKGCRSTRPAADCYNGNYFGSVHGGAAATPTRWCRA